ncbi:hypothetical protein KAS42_03450 [bacterium]|nr:hypothetical protein [bacterium]
MQSQSFKFGLKIKNIDKKNTPKGKIKRMLLRSAEGCEIYHPIDEEFSFPELNPGQEIILWWPNPLTIILKGQAWVGCTVEPENRETTKFITYQFDGNCNKESPYARPNEWGFGIFIRGELEQQQATTNFLIFLLTLLVFLDGVWGLNAIFKQIFKVFGWLFSLIGSLFVGLAG